MKRKRVIIYKDNSYGLHGIYEDHETARLYADATTAQGIDGVLVKGRCIYLRHIWQDSVSVPKTS